MRGLPMVDTKNSGYTKNPSAHNYDTSKYVVLSPIVRDPASGKLVTAEYLRSSPSPTCK